MQNLDAIIREIRSAANDLPAGKKRDVNNKLDRIAIAFKRSKAPAKSTNQVSEEEAERFSSQAKTIYNYLLEGHRITSMDAQRIFGVARLASRICDIEKQTGVTPSRQRIQVTNRFGKEVYVKEYWIEKEDAQ